MTSHKCAHCQRPLLEQETCDCQAATRDPRTNLKLKPAYSAKLEALMPAYRARSKAHLLEMLIDDAERLKASNRPVRSADGI